MTSIEAVHTFLPPDRVSAGECLAAYGFSPAEIRLHERFYGFREVRIDRTGSLADLLVGGAVGMTALRGREHLVRYVLHARTMPVVAPYPINPLREAACRLGLAHAATFTVSQHACASGLLAVDIAGRLLADDPDPAALALVLTGEKVFTASAQVISGTGVMGEGCTGVLISAGGERDQVLSYVAATYGRFSAGPWMSEEDAAAFREEYPTMLADVVRTAVKESGTDLDEIVAILPHNVNRVSWLRVLRLLNIRSAERLILANLPRTGHCFAADSFAAYQLAREQGRLRPGDPYLMTSVGLGATVAAMVLVH
ncbi:3-oxoacyl-[acyl-carrier-protein] synthase III C-terminal domain-containing protein [Solwaraspora sp. WMMD791]|uniref:3-oxoacyl-[acyl-carrier-protein] synthase III C-terminal domain-containing protein n=1 Tax=Solwaraspora sp. WMMD791 TaxID=3016086 RepID=UPI00249AAB6F|nr:3-oxoacyl-[acyl-carrier-protein] synthase III C-terminal domain-containing protein [Solwaraspora sp. WMMD791]WFE28740.1 3-oxoacyl-[acyl-carrier-protein] synthase III C-terminal domain-containing protein [Solwaraspora sp. WMMD791]